MEVIIESGVEVVVLESEALEEKEKERKTGRWKAVEEEDDKIEEENKRKDKR